MEGKTKGGRVSAAFLACATGGHFDVTALLMPESSILMKLVVLWLIRPFTDP